MSPFSPAKMKRAGPVVPLAETVNAVALPVLLNTVPVGAPPSMFTTSGLMVGGLRESYNVDRSVPLSDTQRGVAGPWDSPQALTRLGSVSDASPGTSETRLTWLYRLVLAGSGCLTVAPAGAEVARARADAMTTVASGLTENMKPPR